MPTLITLVLEVMVSFFSGNSGKVTNNTSTIGEGCRKQVDKESKVKS